MTYYIWNRQVGIVEACKTCRTVEKFKELRDNVKRSASKEYPVFINGVILTFVK